MKPAPISPLRPTAPRTAFTRLSLACVVMLAGLPAFAALPAPDADDGAINLPPGFRALVVADNLVVGKRIGNTPEK
ncbi:MAG: hypothetical protein ABIQ12_08050, partial [Opitutaceae bacterium]